jgi:prepilin-type N-terminal cleavage/methylation domain-containing protein
MSRRGFTLVEMLVVIGIIAVLIALLMPAVMSAISRGRNTKMALEVKQLADAVESYKDDKGDYPPNFRNHDVFLKHIRRCYPKIDATHLAAFEALVWAPSPYNVADIDYTRVPNIDDGEALVLWLACVDSDARQPFKSVPTAFSTGVLGDSTSIKRYYDFDDKRLADETLDDDAFPSYRSVYAKDTYYIYIDSRFYVPLATTTVLASAEDPSTNAVRPYWSENLMPGQTAASTAATHIKFKPMNPTSFQIICAGQDGLFGLENGIKQYPGGVNYDLTDRGDHDNITNFSDGKTLQDALP